jgi:hypothetical protein
MCYNAGKQTDSGHYEEDGQVESDEIPSFKVSFMYAAQL